MVASSSKVTVLSAVLSCLLLPSGDAFSLVPRSLSPYLSPPHDDVLLQATREDSPPAFTNDQVDGSYGTEGAAGGWDPESWKKKPPIQMPVYEGVYYAWVYA